MRELANPKVLSDRFIPATMARAIGDGVFFRPIRSWHSNTYAGEGLYKVNGDGSGCLYPEKFRGVLPVCSQPRTVTHRLYWHETQPLRTISAFLSYPDGMGCCSEYFWEVLGVENDDVTRYVGDTAEGDMERAIIKYFSLLNVGVLA